MQMPSPSLTSTSTSTSEWENRIVSVPDLEPEEGPMVGPSEPRADAHEQTPTIFVCATCKDLLVRGAGLEEGALVPWEGVLEGEGKATPRRQKKWMVTLDVDGGEAEDDVDVDIDIDIDTSTSSTNTIHICSLLCSHHVLAPNPVALPTIPTTISPAPNITNELHPRTLQKHHFPQQR
ncbi:hypothetical protein H0H92_014008 [Tricholoma furcatifolium]|nr:hypothetical protein H0H92_014008 [Tricholoma furcatifolium]